MKFVLLSLLSLFFVACGVSNSTLSDSEGSSENRIYNYSDAEDKKIVDAYRAEAKGDIVIKLGFEGCTTCKVLANSISTYLSNNPGSKDYIVVDYDMFAPYGEAFNNSLSADLKATLAPTMFIERKNQVVEKIIYELDGEQTWNLVLKSLGKTYEVKDIANIGGFNWEITRDSQDRATRVSVANMVLPQGEKTKGYVEYENKSRINYNVVNGELFISFFDIDSNSSTKIDLTKKADLSTDLLGNSTKYSLLPQLNVKYSENEVAEVQLNACNDTCTPVYAKLSDIYEGKYPGVTYDAVVAKIKAQLGDVTIRQQYKKTIDQRQGLYSAFFI